jgi:DNA processing protein
LLIKAAQVVEEKVYQLALTLVPGIGDYLTKTLVAYCGSAKAVFSTPKSKLLKIPGIGQGIAQAVDFKTFEQPAVNELDKLAKLGYKAIFFTDSEYPFLLKQANDAPAMLYVAGACTLNHDKNVAIVGTRKATAYGREMAAAIVAGLAPYQPCIVSGLAFGIDVAAHKAAIDAGLPTVAAMATGLDGVYPREHKSITAEIQKSGALVTEYPLGTKPDAPHFPARNRIIAGLSHVTIVVEAAARGGGLITAEIALSYNREVMAVPGNVGHKYSEGCNRLIALNKASIYTCADDVVNLMGWEKPGKNGGPHKTDKLDFSGYQPEEQKIMATLHLENEVHIDDLAWKTGISINQCASVLLSLEFQGMIKALPGKKFRWTGPDISVA